jgi:hypothetical protein
MWRRLTHYTLLFLGLILVISLVSCVDKPKVVMQWYRTFGDGSSQGRSIQQTQDGGYIICGGTNTTSDGAFDDDVWLIKTNADGNKLWDKTFGGKTDDLGNSVQQTTDGSYIICGITGPYYGVGNADVLLIKADADGNKLWDKTFGGSGSDGGNSVQQTIDGGYIVCGTTKSYGDGGKDIWLIKTDAEGNELWDKTFGGKTDDLGNSVQQTADGGYIVCGVAGSHQWYETGVWLIKTDAAGNKLWDKTFGGGGLDGGNSVQQTTDGGYVVCGYTGSYGVDNEDIWLIKTDSGGDKLWDKAFGFRKYDYGYSVRQTQDGGYIICGYIISRWQEEFSISKLLLIKADAKGNKLWDKTFGGTLGYTHGFSVQQTTDGGYIVCGFESTFGPSEVLLLKIAPDR